ncbi:MAG: hypothetical protein Mars2KO_20000 [Maribacter sp.]
MPSIQRSFSLENTSGNTELENVQIVVVFPKFSFRFIDGGQIERFVTDYLSFTISHNPTNKEYSIRLPFTKIVGSNIKDVYGFFLYHFIEVLNPENSINQFSIPFSIVIKDPKGNDIKTEKFEGVLYKSKSASSDYDQRTYLTEKTEFEKTYGSTDDSKNENLNIDGLKKLAKTSEALVYMINKEVFEFIKYRINIGNRDNWSFNDLEVLELIEIITDNSGSIPKSASSRDDIIKATEFIDFFAEKKINVNDDGISAFLREILQNRESLYDFPLSISEVKTITINGNLEIESSIELELLDMEFYDLSLEYGQKNASPVVLRYNWNQSENGIANNKIEFSFTKDNPIVSNNISGQIVLVLKGYDGAVLWSKPYNTTDEELKDIQIKINAYPADKISIDSGTGETKSTKRLRGKVLQHGNKHDLNDLTIVIQANTEHDENFKVVSAGQTDQSGNFSLDFPYGNYKEAQAVVSLIPSDPASIAIVNKPNQTISDDFLYLLISDEAVLPADDKNNKDDDCDCDTTNRAKRLPDQADLIGSDEYTQDIGGSCINLSTPNRTLSEYSYNAIVRVSDPDVANFELKKIVENDGKVKYELVHKRDWPKREEININNPVLWDNNPTSWGDGLDANSELSFYQAASVAAGHILHFKSVFKADGYSLGDLVYSLPLAPGQKKQIVVFESSHSLQGSESQSLSQEEGLTAGLVSERAITDQLSGGINESISGRSRARTSGMSAGLGAAGSYGGIGASLGIAGGFSKSSSSASQNGSRSVSQFFGEKLRQSLMQNAASYRELNASVVTTVTEGQDYGVTTETIANHNHCHSLTMMYFEVMRHFAIYQEISHVEECVFVPLLLTHFTIENIHKWKDILAVNLLPIPSNTYLGNFTYIFGRRSHPLLDAFDANERIKTGYERVDFPEGSYADEEIVEVSGELQMKINIPRPKTRFDRILSLPIIKTGGDVDVGGTVMNTIKDTMVASVAPCAAKGPSVKRNDVVLTKAEFFDMYATMDANYPVVPPAESIRVNFESVEDPIYVNIDGVDTPMDFFMGMSHEKKLWQSYASLLGISLKELFKYFNGNLISDWDQIFKEHIAPTIIEKLVNESSITFRPFGKLDIAESRKYKGGEQIISFRLRPNSSFPRVKRKDVEKLDIEFSKTFSNSVEFFEFITLKVERIRINYSTKFNNNTLINKYVGDDLFDGVYNLYTPLNNQEKKNLKKEDGYLVNELIEHLNSNLEHYNKVLWTNLDPDRRYMLLDGFSIQTYTSSGHKIPAKRSLASVVKNELIAVAGNSLVFPVADGYKVGRDSIIEKTSDGEEVETSLLEYYKPLTPMPPYRLSVPTRGVYMEAIMGKCDACEMVKENSSQDWDKFRTEEPTSIQPIITPTPTITEYRPEYKDFAQPLVNIQNAPDAPAPAAGLAGLNEILGKSDAFRDVTGLAANQQNALETFKANTQAAQEYAKMATSLANQQHNTQNSQGIRESIEQARSDGTISEDDARALTRQHLQQQIDGGERDRDASQFEREQNRTSLSDVAADAVNRGQSVQAERTDSDGVHESIEVSRTSEENRTPLFYDVPLIPQPNKFSCWAASMAMLVSYSRSLRTSSSMELSADELASEVGFTLNQSYGWDRLETVKEHFGFEEIPIVGIEYPTAAQWRLWLDNYGPLYVTIEGTPSHAIIIHGITNETTETSSRLSILNPWNTEEEFDNDPTIFNPPNEGLRAVLSVQDLNRRMNGGDLGILARYQDWRILYLPGLGSSSSNGIPPSGSSSGPVSFRIKSKNRFLSINDPEIKYTASIISAVYSQDINIEDNRIHSVRTVPDGTHTLIITPEVTSDVPDNWSTFVPLNSGGSTPDRIWLEERTTISIENGRITEIGNQDSFSLIGNIVECQLRPLWAKSPHRTTRTNPTPSLVVIHHTGANKDLPPHFIGLQNRTAAAHYVITRGEEPNIGFPGSIIKLVHYEESAYHARGLNPYPNVWHGDSGINNRSIGIEIVHVNGQYKEEQYISVLKLLSDLKERHGILAKNIIGHMDIARNKDGRNPGFLGNRISDPGRLFDWPRIENEGYGIKPSTEVETFAIVPEQDIYGELFKNDSSITIPVSLANRPPNYDAIIEEIKSDLRAIGYHIESNQLNAYDDGTKATVKVFKNRFFSGSRIKPDDFYSARLGFETAKMLKRVLHSIS